MNGSQQSLSLLKQNLKHTKTFMLGKKQQQAAANEDPEDNFYTYFSQYFDLEQILCYNCFHYLSLIVNDHLA